MKVLAPSLVAGGLLLVPVAPGLAAELRFSQTAAGLVVATGNTLGLSKELNANGPGLEDSIGTFISLDAASVDDFPANPANPWPGHTTNDWTVNGSDATLELPLDAEVLHAELVWGGSTAYGSENVTAFLDDPVTLSFGGDDELISPDPITALDIAEMAFSGFAANYYMRSADVTDFVITHGPGVYGVSGVPATQTVEINSLSAAGWTLLVAYRDSTQPIRNLTIFVGGSFVDEDSQEDYDFAGFCTPPSGAFDGSAVITTIEGDADLTGDGFHIAESLAGPFVPLAGPNNPQTNFFCSQLNGSDGQLDTSGTFGMANQNAAGGSNVVGGRQGWDVTTVAMSSAAGQLDNGQTSAILRAITTGDSFVPIGVGFSIEVNAPDFTSASNAAQASPDLLGIGQTSTVTVDMRNDGLVDAQDLVFRAPLPSGLELSSFAIDGVDGDIDGAAVGTADLATGVEIGDVALGQSKQLTFDVTSVAVPDNGELYVITPQWTYDYVSCAGQPPLSEPLGIAPVLIDFDPTSSGTGGLDDTAGETAADSDTGGNSGSGSATGVGDTTGGTSDGATSGLVSFTGTAGTSEPADGCGCRSDRQGSQRRWPWLLVALVFWRRRRGRAAA
ncbi:hypothetical protein [Paraliomyxa miuraensis]|uniref:hypothetical protein n=1 Tax=Paraliomyxa miuraensis TaxID=376150 RepID=UPI002251D724|nr:hypothetical protein [Paraliomyxa miuraensis]MCX4243556.1 DUF11 domain-containing protein [Paraliomyxa miuraensis]